jgi:predicted DNA binding CopG/RHH family protein
LDIKNINIEVKENIWTKLRIKALEEGKEFHEYIRDLLEKEVE